MTESGIFWDEIICGNEICQLSLGAHIIMDFWQVEGELQTGAFVFGTLLLVSQCSAWTLDPKCATWPGLSMLLNWYINSFIVVEEGWGWCDRFGRTLMLISILQVSTHGYSQNQILVWKYPSLVQVAKLTGHTYRVLYLAMSPDGESIVTGAGDETLRFWNVFSKARSQKVCIFKKDFTYQHQIKEEGEKYSVFSQHLYQSNPRPN